MPLDTAKRYGASFHVDGDIVICEIGNLRASGRSYNESGNAGVGCKAKTGENEMTVLPLHDLDNRASLAT